MQVLGKRIAGVSDPPDSFPLGHTLPGRYLYRAGLKVNKRRIDPFCALDDNEIARHRLHVILVRVKMAGILIGIRQISKQIGPRSFRVAVPGFNDNAVAGGVYLLSPAIISGQ